MYLPSTANAIPTPTFIPPALTRAAALHAYGFFAGDAKGDGESQLKRWSSIIGIVTAIVGNILISFALNIQRYAHIRLNRERTEEKERLRSVSKSRNSTFHGYGTADTAECGHTDTDGLEDQTGTVRISRKPKDMGKNGLEADQEIDPLTRSLRSIQAKADGRDGDQEEKTKEATRKTYLSSPYWWAGIGLMTVGETGNFLAYGFAPASIVSPLGVVALISNCVIAPIMLKERFRLRDFWGVLVAIGGAVTIVLSAKQQDPKLGPHEILEAVTRTEFEIYMGITIAVMAVLVWASPRYGNKTILIDLGLVGLFGEYFRMTAMIRTDVAGGYTALSTKGVASMLSSTLWRAFTAPVTYVLLLILIGTALMQVKFLNQALQRFDSTQVIPVQFVLFTLSVIIGSAILFRDFEKATAESMGKFVGGCLLTFFGVFLITSGRPGHEDEDEDDTDEDYSEEESVSIEETSASYDLNEDTNYDRHETPSRRQSRQLSLDTADSDDDSRVSGSRRGSHAGPTNMPTNPETPRRRQSNASQNPSLLLTRAPESAQHRTGSQSTPYLENPWATASSDLLAPHRHPGFQSTTSSPVLPSQTQSPSASKPPHVRALSQTDPHTHPNDQDTPNPPRPDVRPTTPVYHSFSRIMPGPLVSPLSSSLSAVVADSLLRGVDAPLRKKQSFRRPRLGLRRSKSGSGHVPDGSEAETETLLGSSPLKNTMSARDSARSASEQDGRSRSRSMSNTLGDWLKGKTGRREGEDGRHSSGGV